MGTTAEKLTYLNTTKEKLKDTINYTGANITSSTTFRNYNTKLYNGYIDILKDNGETLFNNMPHVIGSGTNITLSNTENTRMSLKLNASELSQEGTPSPSSPQSIHKITGNNNIVVSNKNLFNIAYMTQKNYNANGIELANFYTINNNELSISRNNANSGRTFFNKLLLQSGTYTLSFKIVSSSGNDKNFWRSVRNMDDLVDIVSSSKIAFTDNTTYQVQFTLPSATNIGVSINPNDASTGTLIISNIQLEKSSSATEYIEHKLQTRSIDLGNIELCKINNYSDEIFKNTTDSIYYDSTLQLNKWYIKKNVGKIVLNGSEEYLRKGENARNLPYLYIANNSINKINGGIVLCDKFEQVSDNITWRTETLINAIATETNNSVIQIMINDSSLDTLDKYKTYLSNNNVTIYFPKATATYELLSDILQVQFNDLYFALSYEEQTNITQTNADLPFNIDATAIKVFSE